MTAVSVVHKQYVEWRDRGYYLTESRVSLDSIIDEFLKGTSPESIVQAFPMLNLEQVYGAIAFYLANQEVIDAYLEEGDQEFEQLRQAAREKNADFYAKLEAARAQRQ